VTFNNGRGAVRFCRFQDLNVDVDAKRDVLLSAWGRMPFSKAFRIVV
jgi:hypothetical protein